MTPCASPPAFSTASAILPIRPTLPPPYTKPMFLRTNSATNFLSRIAVLRTATGTGAAENADSSHAVILSLAASNIGRVNKIV